MISEVICVLLMDANVLLAIETFISLSVVRACSIMFFSLVRRGVGVGLGGCLIFSPGMIDVSLTTSPISLESVVFCCSAGS